jgi:hypothetical protein
MEREGMDLISAAAVLAVATRPAAAAVLGQARARARRAARWPRRYAVRVTSRRGPGSLIWAAMAS